MKKKLAVAAAILPALIFIIWLLWPVKYFNAPCSTVLLANDSTLMGAVIASDQQWRFPHNDNVPDKFKKALVTFEDRYFYQHPGINPVAIVRALFWNIKKGRIVSGGSTISMQLVRISGGNRERTILRKIKEALLTFKLEFIYGKDDILAMYASNAPMGGNVVGLDAAAWRYFGRSAHRLSWAETATLAVLPNSPSLIFPGKNENRLLEKRNRLLDKLHHRGYIDAITCELSKTEPLPSKPHPLPRMAPHLMNRVMAEGYEGQTIVSTIDYDLQNKVNDIVLSHHKILKNNEINNIAALVIDVSEGQVLAYCGNIPSEDTTVNGYQVDVINARRSPGSLLKPLLYAAMLDEGKILQGSLVADIPTQIGSYAPANFNRSYDGAVPAAQALSRSLNVPAVRMLMVYGVDKFCRILQKSGLTTIDKPPSHYGLSVILGGAEISMWELAGAYASMARELNNYTLSGGQYLQNAYHAPTFITQAQAKPKYTSQHHLFSAGTLWSLFNALVEVARPDEDSRWQLFSSSHKVAWKTGTSFGYRDGWAIGTTPQYVVAVWTGNASGEGRPGLIGVYTAAPVMLDIFKHLKPQGWFARPDANLIRMKICKQSGYKASDICPQGRWTLVPASAIGSKPCPYHKTIHLDMEGSYQVNAACASVYEMKSLPWFVLPPVQESYFRQKHSFYKVLPPFRSDCITQQTDKNMGFVYPEPGARVLIPRELDGKPGKMVVKVVHRNAKATVYWHLNETFIGSTSGFHHKAINAEPGVYMITVVDNKGEKLSRKFEILH